MFAVIGLIVVLGSVVGGYVLEHGNLSLLFQPVELLIIGGAAVGAFFISSTPRVFSIVLKSLGSVLAPRSQNKENYLELLSLLYQLFSKIRKEGLVSIESDIERPEASPIFRKFPSVLTNHHMLSFICDNLKVIITANIPPHELDNLMDIEIDTHHHQALIPAHSISKIADGLPALGIVAAVLGVVLTMSKINEPPAVLGASIGAALIGTFLGVLLSYGFVGPIATNLESQAEENAVPLQVVKVALVAFVGGSAPQMAVEFGRRAVADKEKPTFDELEKIVRGRTK
jgi:chemotaxis protein MotA